MAAVIVHVPNRVLSPIGVVEGLPAPVLPPERLRAETPVQEWGCAELLRSENQEARAGHPNNPNKERGYEWNDMQHKRGEV